MRSRLRQTLRATRPDPRTNMARQVGDFVIGHTWMWPTLETLHFVGLCLLFTVVLIVNLRLLGAIKIVPVSAVYQMLPLGMVGFAMNLVTGMLFFLGIPSQYNANPVFYWKIVFVLLGGVNVMYFMLADDAWRTPSGATRRPVRKSRPRPQSSSGSACSTAATCCRSSATPSDASLAVRLLLRAARRRRRRSRRYLLDRSNHA